MKLIQTFLVNLGAIASLSIVVNPANAIPKSVTKVADLLVGIMDTTQQAAAINKAPSVQMTTCKINALNSDRNSIYLYQEQALTRNIKKPYRQRFLQIKSTKKDNIVESISYKLKNPQNWQGLCDRHNRTIAISELGTLVCNVYLKPLINVHIGKTKPGGCPTQFRGATTITNTIILYERGMDTWDRGFDRDGKQVWGAIARPYEFRRVDPG